jgi:hypothetical protein
MDAASMIASEKICEWKLSDDATAEVERIITNNDLKRDDIEVMADLIVMTKRPFIEDEFCPLMQEALQSLGGRNRRR